jgi:hypothetical protein
MTLRLLPLLAVLGALLLPASALAEPVATPGASTTVREYAGILVFSQFVDGGYRLMVKRGDAPAQALPVDGSDRPFNADIGRGAAGPQLVYERCGETCDLFTYTLGDAGPSGERAIRNANDPEHHDTNPTIWRGRIAWSRIYGEQRDRKVIVYTKLLTARRSTPSTRLPGVPERRCGDVDRVCGPTTARSVNALELWGDNLAQVVDYSCRGCAGIAQTELRLVRVSTRRASQIAFQVTGLSGQSLAGPSFANGWLSWYMTCLGDPAACQGDGGGPWRHSLSNGSYARSTSGPERIDGFADTMTYLYEVVGCSPETAGNFNADCRIDRVPAPDYERTRAPLRG